MELRYHQTIRKWRLGFFFKTGKQWAAYKTCTKIVTKCWSINLKHSCSDQVVDGSSTRQPDFSEGTSAVITRKRFCLANGCDLPSLPSSLCPNPAKAPAPSPFYTYAHSPCPLSTCTIDICLHCEALLVEALQHMNVSLHSRLGPEGRWSIPQQR